MLLEKVMMRSGKGMQRATSTEKEMIFWTWQARIFVKGVQRREARGEKHLVRKKEKTNIFNCAMLIFSFLFFACAQAEVRTEEDGGPA